MWIDVGFAVFAALGFYWGYSRGVIRAVVSLVAVFVGFVAAVRFAPSVTAILTDLLDKPATGAWPLIGFVVAFVLVLVLLRLAATLVERALTAVRLNGVNKLAGGLASALATTLLYSVIVMFVDGAGAVTIEAKNDSMTYDALEALPTQAYALLGEARPAFEQLRDAGREAVRSSGEAGAEPGG